MLNLFKKIFGKASLLVLVVPVSVLLTEPLKSQTAGTSRGPVQGMPAILDLGATNGTWVGGERVDQAEMSNQSEFTLGSTTLMLIVTSSTLH